MRLNLNVGIMRQMTDGVILLNARGQQVEINPAAEPWSNICAALAPALRRMIVDEMQGRAQMPIALDLVEPGFNSPGTIPDAWLCKNGRREYAIVIVGKGASRLPSPPLRKPRKVSDRAFVSLIGEPVRHELAMFRKILMEAGKTGHSAEAISPELGRQVDKVATLLGQLSDLATLSDRDESLAEQRVELGAMFRDLLPSLSLGCVSSFQVETFPASTGGVVYGNSTWLRRALQSLLIRLARHAPPKSKVVVTLRQMGDFVMVSARTASSNLAVSGGAGEAHVGATAGASLPHDDLDHAICQRIIDLHGGQLKCLAPRDADLQATDAIEFFALTLPTGQPTSERSRASCADCRYTIQAQAFAKDLSELLTHAAAN